MQIKKQSVLQVAPLPVNIIWRSHCYIPTTNHNVVSKFMSIPINLEKNIHFILVWICLIWINSSKMKKSRSLFADLSINCESWYLSLYIIHKFTWGKPSTFPRPSLYNAKQFRDKCANIKKFDVWVSNAFLMHSITNQICRLDIHT